jgi:hypothetical protein
VNRKLHKVEESAAPYTAQNPAAKAAAAAAKQTEPDVRAAVDVDFNRTADKIFTERKELLHKLAQ